MPIAIITALIQLVEMGITVAPEVIAAAQAALSLLEGRRGRRPRSRRRSTLRWTRRMPPFRRPYRSEEKYLLQ